MVDQGEAFAADVQANLFAFAAGSLGEGLGIVEQNGGLDEDGQIFCWHIEPFSVGGFTTSRSLCHD
jgi:hypothetical protein